MFLRTLLHDCHYKDLAGEINNDFWPGGPQMAQMFADIRAWIVISGIGRKVCSYLGQVVGAKTPTVLTTHSDRHVRVGRVTLVRMRVGGVNIAARKME